MPAIPGTSAMAVVPTLSRLTSLTAWFTGHAFFASLLTAAALALSAVLVRNVGDPDSGHQRRTATVVLLLLAGVVLALGSSLFFVRSGKWGYVLALLPGAIIARHAVYMRLIRRRALAAPVDAPTTVRRAEPPIHGQEEDASLEMTVPGLSRVFARARQMNDLDFAPDTLAVRFGIPALLTTFIGIGVFEFVFADLTPGIALMHPARCGAAGAMVYVLLYLGQRGFRNDITTGAAVWSAIVLAVGPMFGAALSLIWAGDTSGNPWTRDALYFVAGMSPRHVASAVEEAVRRLWLTRAPTVQVQSRLQPLGQLRGVTPAIEDRLAEEGIADLQGMAMADPLKLFRSTSFDKRQILSWMDEALLISWLPDHWTALQKVGVTGAIDLMAQVELRQADLRKVLTNTAKLDPADVDAVVLAGTVLKEDAQLRLVWALYQFDEDGLVIPPASAELADAVNPAIGTTGSLAIPALGWLLGGLALILCAAFAGDTRVPMTSMIAPAALLLLSFAIALTARWPWSNGSVRAVPIVMAVLVVGAAFLGRHAVSASLAGEWPMQRMLLAAAAGCAGVFFVGLLAGAVGANLTVEFPHGAPPDCELWVDGRAVPVVRTPGSPTACWVANRRVAVVVRSSGAEHLRWLDVRGHRSPRLSLPLPATVVVQVQPSGARPLRFWVDGVEAMVGDLMLWPRSVPYSIGVEADGFVPGTVSLTVAAANVIGLPIQLEPLPHGPPPPPPPPPLETPTATITRSPAPAPGQSIVVDAASHRMMSKAEPPMIPDGDGKPLTEAAQPVTQPPRKKDA